MGVTTSFFTATFEQLEAAAPGWKRPTYGAYVEREARNPFTREPMVVRSYELFTEPPDACPPDTLHQLIQPGRAFAWKLGPLELPCPMRRLTNAPDDVVAELERRALLGPPDAECWVFEIPEAALLEQLVEVASEAVAADRRMFSYVSL